MQHLDNQTRPKSNNVIAVLMKEITTFFPPTLNYPKILSVLERAVGDFSHLIDKQHERHCTLRTVDSQLGCGKEKAEMDTKEPEDE